MFAFSQVQPETTGAVTDMEVPFGDYLAESASEAVRLSPVASAYRWSQLYQEENDPDQQKLLTEQANKLYATDTLRFTEPITETAASMLHDRHLAMADSRFILSNDNHGAVSGAIGMTTGMVAAMADPVNLALMFINPVGSAPLSQTRTVASMGMLGRGAYVEEKLAQGLITRETLQTMVPFHKLAETVIQGASFMTLAEIPKQLFAKGEHEDVGEPLLNIAEGTALAGLIHVGLEGLGRLWRNMSPETKQALFTEGLNQFVKGEDYDLHSLALTDEAFSDFHYENQMAQANDINWSEFGGWKQEPLVPTTESEPARQYSSVLDEIRQKKARTKEQIQTLFPKAELTREQAADLRRQAWNEPAPEQVRQKNIQDYFEQQSDSEKWISAKRQARIDAERKMPNPITAVVEEQAHAVIAPEEKTIAAVDKQTQEVKKKVTPVTRKLKPKTLAKKTGFELKPAISYEGLPPELLEKMPEQPLHFTDKRPGSPTEGLSITLPPGSTHADFKAAVKAKVEAGWEPINKAVKKESIFHATEKGNDLTQTGRPHYFGDKEFQSFDNFGDHVQEYTKPEKILDLNNPDANTQTKMVEIMESIWGKKEIQDSIAKTSVKEVLADFYNEVWTDCQNMEPYFKKYGIDAFHYGDEWLISPEAIKKLDKISEVKIKDFEQQQAKLKEADKVKPVTEAIDSAADCLTKKLL